MLTTTLLVSIFAFVTPHGFHEHCRESLSVGRQNIEIAAESLGNAEIASLLALVASSKARIHEHQAQRTLLSDDLQSVIGHNNGEDSQPCPQPNHTMFTTPSPTTATTGSGKFQATRIYTKLHDEDPFANYMSTLHNYLSREDTVCNNEIIDINSITEDQLFGYFSTLAAAHPGPFCSLCHRFGEEVHQRIFTPNRLLTTDDEFHLNTLLFSHVPSPKSICSAIAPGCHADYALKVANLTESVICLECTACMSVTNVIQHKFLLQKQIVDATYVFLRGNLFHNLCAELCWAFNGKNMLLFPNGFTYDGCQAVMKKKFYQTIDVATVILRPERFCSLELQWCELNEQPNAIHCLRELCQEYFKDTPQTRWLCSQIPDRPEKADAFLNIRQTKIYKEKKEYHAKFSRRNLHDEL